MGPLERLPEAVRTVAGRAPPARDPGWWHVPLLLAVSASFEALFIRSGVPSVDEGWALYAASGLRAGGTLYEDVFWVFPPGSLLPAWVASWLAPPGLVLSRLLYAAWNVALCLVLYALGRRLMPPSYALLGGLLVAMAAPSSHLVHVLFGYRYLLFSALALLSFSERLRSGRARWTYLAGGLTGAALLFRLTPAAAVSAGIAVGILSMGGSWRDKWWEGVRFAAGLGTVAFPALAWLAADMGLGVVWTEVIVRPLVMTRLQGLPVPTPSLPSGLGRWELERAFSTLEFWLYPALYLAYAGWLVWRWIAARRARKPFQEVLLAAVVTWGGVFLLRSYGRADVFHLESAIAPVCLLLAHLAHSRLFSRSAGGSAPTLARVTAVLLAWIWLNGVDLYASRDVRGQVPLAALEGRVRTTPQTSALVDAPVQAVERLSPPGATLLDLSASPFIHVLSGRPGVGGADVLMPGTYADAAEESAQLERIAAAPPAVVVVPLRVFDGRPERAAWEVAPRIFEWVRARYVVAAELEHYLVLVPSEARAASTVPGPPGT